MAIEFDNDLTPSESDFLQVLRGTTDVNGKLESASSAGIYPVSDLINKIVTDIGSDYLEQSDIYNGLDSEDTTKALGAEQGKALKDAIDSNSESVATNATNISTNATKLSAEILRAKGAETANADDIGANAQNIVAIAQAIVAEKERAEGVEGELRTDVNRVYYKKIESYNNVGEHYINIPLIIGQSYKITNNTTDNIGLASANESKAIVEKFDNPSSGESVFINITQNAYYLYIYFITDGNVTIERIDTEISSLKDELLDFVDSSIVGALLGNEEIELLDISTMIDGYYIPYTTGILSVLSDFSSTDFIPVKPNLTVTVNGGVTASQTSFYDSNYTYLTGEVTGENNIIVPNNESIKYMRWCTQIVKKTEASLNYAYIESVEKIVEVTDSDSILEGLIEAYNIGASKVIVYAGDYDVISEYENYYGSDYFTNYTTMYNGQVNGKFDFGIWLDGIEIEFKQGAKVYANYTGTNANAIAYFSPFAIGNNAKIDGLVLESSNLRYGIHPDFQSETYGEITFVNCDLSFVKGSSNRAIGAGLGVHSFWTIENCIFRSTQKDEVFKVHNNVSSESKSKIIIKDCYIDGQGFFGFNSYSTSTKITDVLVSNCSWISPPETGLTTPESEDNINLISWNNETRT